MGIYSELNAACAAVGVGTKDLGPWCNASPLPSPSHPKQLSSGPDTGHSRSFWGCFWGPGMLCSSSSSKPKHLIANLLQMRGCRHKPWLLPRRQPAQLPPVTLCRSYCSFIGRPGQKKVASCGFAPLNPSSPRCCCSPWSPRPHQEKHGGNYQSGEREKHPHLCGERRQ